jgi:hypothetical protein
MAENRPLTIFLDIDGCIFEHPGHPNAHITKPEETKLLDGVKEKFIEWIMKEYKIILTSGRKECTRKETEDQLRYHGLCWDQLILGVGGGIRVLINDTKPSTTKDTAVAITIVRNEGLKNISI